MWESFSTDNQGTDGKGKEIVDDEGVSSVKKEGSGELGVGSRPGLRGRMPALPTVASKQYAKVRSQEEVDSDSYRSLVGK